MASLLIEAGPGTGKTTTVGYITAYLRSTNKELWLQQNPKLTEEQKDILDWCATNLPQDGTIIGMAYNKEAADQLGHKTHKSVECRSVHGWGYKQILAHMKGYVQVSDSANLNLIERLTGQRLQSLPDKYMWISAARYFEKLKEELLEPTMENLRLLSIKYEDLASFRFDDTTVQRIRQLMPLAKKPDRKTGITYMDQVWLALFLLMDQNGQAKPVYDVAIIDECQDISPARRVLCNSIARHKIWIGDRYQAINAYAGADPHSIDRIIELVDVQLPLKTSFRCPPYVIDKLNKQKPLAKLKGLPKPNGVEERIELENLPQKVEEVGEGSSLIICRTNAPLIRAAYKLLEQNVPCRIIGDKVVDQLASIVKKMQATTMGEFEQKLDKYESNIVRNLDEYVAELFKDKINCLRLVIPHSNSPDDIVTNLRTLFKPSGDGHVRLSTIHKAKGLEARNIFILFPPIESPLAKSQDQKDQESNLRYVAESRTSFNTFWVV